MRDQRFWGTWKLKSMVKRSPSGQVSQPLSENPLGYITYTPEGFMHAILMKSGRNPIGLFPEELRDALSSKRIFFSFRYILAGLKYLIAITSCVSYCGTYEVKGDTVAHHVTASMVPDWIGADLSRQFLFGDGYLTLIAKGHAGAVMELVWERVS